MDEILELITKDETLRVEALSLAVKAAQPGANDPEAQIERAEVYLNYIKNGVANGED